MKTPDIELYAHVTQSADGQWDLAIGREVPGNPSHGAATLVGTFATSADAADHAIRRGVPPGRIAVFIH